MTCHTHPFVHAPRAGVQCLALLGLALAWASAAAAPGSPKEGAAYRDWVVRCERADGPPTEQQCFIVQNLVLKENNQRVMLIAVTYPPDQADPVVVLTLPLGISLPPGVSLRVDGDQPRRYQIDRCLNTGCKAGFVLDAKLLQRFKAGIKAEVTIHDASRKPVTLPVSLVGFTAGLAALR